MLEWLIAHLGEVPSLSVVDVQRGTGAGAGTVIRTCQAVGFHGFHEFRIAAAREGRYDEPAEPDSLAGYQALRTVERAASESVRHVSATVPEADFDAAVATLTAADRLLVFGAAMSGPIAADAAYRFRMAGWFVDAPADESSARVAARQLTRHCACLLFSHTGATKVTLDVAAQARRAGAAVVGVVSQSNSALSEIAPITLAVAGDDGGALGIATGSRLAQLVITHSLLTAAVTAKGPAARAALDRAAEVTHESVL